MPYLYNERVFFNYEGGSPPPLKLKVPQVQCTLDIAGMLPSGFDTCEHRDYLHVASGFHLLGFCIDTSLSNIVKPLITHKP